MSLMISQHLCTSGRAKTNQPTPHPFPAENPCPEQGDIIQIKLSEHTEVLPKADGTGSTTMLVDTVFEMNYSTGQWTRLKKYKPITNTSWGAALAQETPLQTCLRTVTKYLHTHLGQIEHGEGERLSRRERFSLLLHLQNVGLFEDLFFWGVVSLTLLLFLCHFRFLNDAVDRREIRVILTAGTFEYLYWGTSMSRV